MSLLDDARKLANISPIRVVVAQGGQQLEMCCFCWGQFAHEPDCLWISMQKIVLVLEAAEWLVEAGDPVETDRGGRGVCHYCLAPNYVGDYLSFGPPKDVEHEAECPYGALLTAFRGESA